MDYREADKWAQEEFVDKPERERNLHLPVLTAQVYYPNGASEAQDFTGIDNFNRMIKWLAQAPTPCAITVWEDGARVPASIIAEHVEAARPGRRPPMYAGAPEQGTILCADRFSIPVEDPLSDFGFRRFDCAALLVAGGTGDYAVYVGSGSDDFISRKGRKLTFVQAQQHFAGLEESRYRR